MDIPKNNPNYQNRTLERIWVLLIPVLFFLVHLSGDHVFNKTNTLKMVLLLIVSTILLITKVKSKSLTQQTTLLLLLLSPLLATFPGLAISQGQYSYSLPYEFIGQLLCIIWCYLLVTTPDAINTPKKIAYLLIPVVVFACLIGILEKLGLNPLIRFYLNPFERNWQSGPEIYMGAVNRIKSTFGNVNYFASFLIQLIPLCITLFYIGWQQVNTTKYPTNIYRIVITGLTLLIFSCLVFTGTRAAIMALALSFTLILGLYLFTYKRALSIYLFLAAIGVAALLFFILSEYDQRFTDLLRINAWHSRIVPWQTAIASIKEAPFFGYGLGSSYELFFNFRDIDASIRISNGSYNHVHAEPLEVLQEGGIFGLLIYMFFWGWIFLIGSRFIFERQISSHLRLLVAAILCGLLAFHIHGLFSVAPRMIAARMTAYTLVALLLVLTQRYNLQSKVNNTKTWPLYFIGICLIVSTVWLASYAKSQYLYAKALASSTPNIQMIELTKHSTDIYTLHKAALSATELNDPDALKNITKKLKQLFPHYRKTDYFSAYGLAQSHNTTKAKKEALQVQALNTYQTDIGLLLASISIAELNEKAFRTQFSIALKSLACKANIIDCEHTKIKTLIGNMQSPVQFINKPGKVTVLIDQSFLPYLQNMANSLVLGNDSAINTLTLEYAQVLGGSDFFKPANLATTVLNRQDHQFIESHVKSQLFITNSNNMQKKAYRSQLQSNDSLQAQIDKFFEVNRRFITRKNQAEKVIKNTAQKLADKLHIQNFLNRRNLQLQLASWLAQSTHLTATLLDKPLPSRKIPTLIKSPKVPQGIL
jgi:O-antigen ligase